MSSSIGLEGTGLSEGDIYKFYYRAESYKNMRLPVTSLKNQTGCLMFYKTL